MEFMFLFYFKYITIQVIYDQEKKKKTKPPKIIQVAFFSDAFHMVSRLEEVGNEVNQEAGTLLLHNKGRGGGY